MCGGHHVAAGGGKLHELGARILGLEAGDVRGDVVNLLVHWQVGGRRSSLLTVAMPTLSGNLQAPASRS